MGIVNGSLSISRYRILGEGKLSHKFINKNLQNYVGKDLLESTVRDEITASWVMPSATIAATEEREGDYWDLADCELDDSYILKLRVEKRKVPSELLNHVAKKEISRMSEERGKRVSRPEQKEIKDMLKEELVSKALPQVTYFDVVWKHEEQEVWLLSTAKNTRILFEELFQKTFLKKSDGALIPIEAPLLGFSKEEWSDDSSKLDTIFNIVPSAVESSNEHYAN